MKKLMVLSISVLIAFYAGQAAAGSACPKNADKNAKTNPSSVKAAESRVLAGLKMDKAVTTTSKKNKKIK